MTIGITGGYGFLGWHLRCHLHSRDITNVVLADRDTFESDDALDAFVRKSRVVIHAAGVNRAHSDEAVGEGNVVLAVRLAEALKRTASTASIVYTNSTKIDQPGIYGQSKAEAARILGNATADAGSSFDDIVLPHLFGEYGKPFYNSVVHTFAHQIVAGERCNVDNDSPLELLHAQRASSVLVDHAFEPKGGQRRVEGEAISVSEVLARLETLASPYLANGSIPNLDHQLDLELFNLIRSTMTPRGYPISYVVHQDQRGCFYEVLRSFGPGQTSISTTGAGITRGDHYHLAKVERFVVVSGQATIAMRRLFHEEVWEFEVSDNQPVAVDMTPLTTHSITNTGSGDLVTLFWSNDHFNPDDPDTFIEPVRL
ncbi:MAG: NAD-dependent epimerase/dehydratase family protein [Acidimicrobiales bacterium]